MQETRFTTCGVRFLPALLVILAVIVVLNGISAVTRTDYPTGWDGYYYLVQVQSLRTIGEMHSPEYSLVYVPLLAFHTVTGDYLASYRISAVLILLLYVLSVFVFTRSLLKSTGGSRRLNDFSALMTAGFSAMSPSLNYFFTQFPKNLLGFAMLLLFMSCVFSAVKRWRDRRSFPSGRGLYVRWAGAAALFLASFFTHRFSAVLALFFLLLYFTPSSLRMMKLLWTGGIGRHGRMILGAAAACILLAVVLFVSSRLPLAPSIADMERITADISPTPIFVPSSFMAAFGTFKMTPAWVAGTRGPSRPGR